MLLSARERAFAMKSIPKITTASALAAAAFAVLVAAPPPALAGTADIGTVAYNLRRNFGPVADLIGVIFFMIGVIMGGMGVMKFRQSKQGHGQGDIGEAITLVLVGSVLVALPMMLGVGVTSIFGSTGDALSVDGGGLRSIR